MVKTPTFAISPELKRYPDAPSNGHHRGFTLIELLVVMAIAGMLVAIIPSSLEKLRDATQYRDAVRAVMADLRQARQQAVAYGQVAVFRVDLAERQYGVLGQPLKKLPVSLEVKTTVGVNAPEANIDQSDIIFLPDGGSTGGTIELARHSGAGTRVRVDWLLGLVTQEQFQQ